MIRLVTAAAFGLTLVLIAAAIVTFITGWWIVGILATLGAIVGAMFTLTGLSIIALQELDA